MPPENPRTIWLARSVSLNFSSSSSARSLRSFERDAEVRRVENQNLARRQGEIEIRTLRHDSDQPLDLGLLLPYVVIADPGLSAGGAHPRGENADRGGLARAVGPEQSEDLSGLDFERQSVESGDLGFGLLRILRVGARDETSGGAQRRRRVVDLAQICGANANSHG